MLDPSLLEVRLVALGSTRYNLGDHFIRCTLNKKRRKESNLLDCHRMNDGVEMVVDISSRQSPFKEPKKLVTRAL